MYVCICNAITDREIKQAVKHGHDSYEKICSQLGTANCCGRCESHVREVIDDVHFENNNAMPPPIIQMALA